MSLATVYTRARVGMQAPLVSVEVHLAHGLPAFVIVGLPATAVKESKDRVRSALLNSGFRIPDRRIVVNLAPADLPKQHCGFDLAIAIAVLLASGQIECDDISAYEFFGELGLLGDIRGTSGTLAAVVAAHQQQRTACLPVANQQEGSLVPDAKLLFAAHLTEVVAGLCKHESANFVTNKELPQTSNPYPDIADVKGHAQAKRLLLIAAAGGHSVLFIGPPGTGKTLLASRLPSLLPALEIEQALEVATIYSSAHQGFDVSQWRQVPYRAPHHGSSAVALIGGSNPPQPGEISLAHRGVLFLDELPEFKRSVLEALREPLEAKQIVISRAAQQVCFPANFQLIAAMNPCPCGHWGDPRKECRCTVQQVNQYQQRLSGPLLDRIDMQYSLQPVANTELFDRSKKQVSSAELRAKVAAVQSLQRQRQKCLNANLSGKALEQHASLSQRDQRYFIEATHALNLSTRAYHRVLKLALTIADLEGGSISRRHLAEALGYRQVGLAEDL